MTGMVSPDDGPERPLPLIRNQNYRILWSGMFLSELVSEIAFIAFPLLILAHSGSALEVGLVVSVLAATRMALNLPAGVIADRWDRKRIMMVAQGVRSAAMLSIAVALLAGSYSLEHVLIVAAVEGAFSSMFPPAEHAALPRVVPAGQLSEALARNAARPFAALLLGPAIAGFTFGVHQIVPFSINTGVLALSFLALAALRLPRSSQSEAPPTGATGDVPDQAREYHRFLDGLRWLLGHRVLRATLGWIIAVNLAFHALVIMILIMSGENGVAYGEIGLMMTCFGAGGLVGALVAGRLHAILPAPVTILGSSWIFATVAAVMAFAPRGLPLGLLLGAAAFCMPVAVTTILTYQLSVVPDKLRGRLTGVVGLGSDLAGTVGPVLGAILITATGRATTAVLVVAAGLALVAVSASISPTLRRFPTLRPATVGDRLEPESPTTSDGGH